MKISVFGLGYVGCVGAACMAEAGHDVTGVDVIPTKVDLLNAGEPTVVEPGLGPVLEAQVKAGRVRATQDATEAVRSTDLSLISVGTPTGRDGRPNLDYVYNVAAEIGRAISDKGGFHTIAIRSTVPPGTTDRVTEIIAEQSDGNADFGVASNPEFLREGSAVADFRQPPFTVIGTRSPEAVERLREVYSSLDAPFYATVPQVSEMLKYACNSFHALKVVFANELGRISKELGVDSHEVMELFCLDTDLNISSRYLRPGYAYGGSCLPKDVKGLTSLARDVGVDVPVLDGIEASNEAHKRAALNTILSSGVRRVGILGLAFKAGTDDLRSSPAVDLAESLLGKGYELVIYDRNVELSKLVGANSQFIADHIPHLADLITDQLDHVLEESELLVVTQRDPELMQLAGRTSGHRIIDLAGLRGELEHNSYEGIGW